VRDAACPLGTRGGGEPRDSDIRVRKGLRQVSAYTNTRASTPSPPRHRPAPPAPPRHPVRAAGFCPKTHLQPAGRGGPRLRRALEEHEEGEEVRERRGRCGEVKREGPHCVDRERRAAVPGAASAVASGRPAADWSARSSQQEAASNKRLRFSYISAAKSYELLLRGSVPHPACVVHDVVGQDQGLAARLHRPEVTPPVWAAECNGGHCLLCDMHSVRGLGGFCASFVAARRTFSSPSTVLTASGERSAAMRGVACSL
jgi:hypothetical protein